MKVFKTPTGLTVQLDERIDAVNAAATEKTLQQLADANPGRPICLDATRLRYISSSGLRVLLALQRKLGPNLSVRNVSPTVYDVFEVTGFAALMDVRKKLQVVRVDGCPVIGKGAFGTVYRLNRDTVVKVFPGAEDYYPMIRREQQKARQAFLMGVPTAIPFDIVQVDDCYGAEFEMVDARSCNKVLRDEPGRLDEIIARYSDFFRGLHALTDEEGVLPDAKSRCLQRIDSVARYLSPHVRERLTALVQAMPDNNHLVHGDAHLNNVMVTGDSLMLIDMDTLCSGDPVHEFAALFMTYIAFPEEDPEDTMAFHGIPYETTVTVFRRALAACVGAEGGDVPEAVMRRISILGYLRFLEVLTVEQADRQDEQKDRQIRHAAARLEELVDTVDSLVLTDPA